MRHVRLQAGGGRSGRALPGMRCGCRAVDANSCPLYFKSGCEQQPSPNARETRPPRWRVLRFVRRDSEGWDREVGRGVSRSLHRRVARTPPLADRIGRKSLRVSRGAGCRVKTGSGPLERSLPPGSGAPGRGRTGANSDPWVMTANGATGVVRIIRLGMRSPHGIPRGRVVELRATMRRARRPRA